MDQSELEEVRIKKIGVLSLANTLALVSLFISLVIGIIFSILALVGVSLLSSLSATGVSQSSSTGQIILISLIFLPVSATILGFIQGLLIGWFYNLSSKISRGIKLYA
ncbi:MAG: hypothetical protein AABY22_23230 [Nanoarchaeota archaeon]